MSRIILISSFATLLAASGIQSANATQTANQDARARDAQARADADIAPDSGAFSQCVSDLHHALRAGQNLEQN